jgi:hypothetical protein
MWKRGEGGGRGDPWWCTLNLHLYFFLMSNQTLFLLFLDICARIAEVFAHCSCRCQNAGYILNRAFTKVLTLVLCQQFERIICNHAYIVR